MKLISKKFTGGVFALGLSSASVQAKEYHYPPARLDCRTASGMSITFFQYATGSEANKRYNGNLYIGPLGEQDAHEYDRIQYVDHLDSSIDFTATPNRTGSPRFEMHLDRPENTYVGGIDLIYSSGARMHYRFQSCTESSFINCQ